MGQQQLILLVLATVIVGIAIVVGIAAFTENSAKANVDAMIQDAVRMSNDAQAWKKKPAPFGGQASLEAGTPAVVNAPGNFTGATFALLGYQQDADGIYTNLNGQYQITTASDAGLTITGINTQEVNEVTVTTTGMSDADIAGAVVCLNGQDNGGDDCVAEF